MTPQGQGDRPPRQPDNSLEAAKRWAAEYLRRQHSEQEVRRKLRERGVSDGDADEVIALCLDYGFINDAEYAGSIVRHYAAMGYGPGRIRSELNRRGVPKELWDEALAELPAGGDTIDRLLNARLRGRDLSDRKERERVTAYLYRRGFAWSDIRAALSRYGDTEDDFFEDE